MNVLKYLSTNLDSNSWEKLIDSCYRIKYQQSHFQKVPSSHLGDYGIEGYTRDGIVYQCYYPEQNYSNDELYEHLRNKMTTDIKKLMENGEKLKSIGCHTIKEWHFVIPEYKDKRILQHAKTKVGEVLQKKKTENELGNDCEHIDSSFDIIIKVADDLAFEIDKIFMLRNSEVKLDATMDHDCFDVSNCGSEKVQNIKRKLLAIMNTSDESNEQFKKLLNIHVKFYLRGLRVSLDLRTHFAGRYEELYKLQQSCEGRFKVQTLMNDKAKLNKTLFDKIISEFDNDLESLTFLTKSTRMQLVHDIIAGWLADCSMEFVK